MGIKLQLKVLDNKIAYIDAGLNIEYHTWPRERDEICISGDWGIQSIHNDIFTLHYLTAKLNFRRPVIEAFRRDEKDWEKLWLAKHS